MNQYCQYCAFCIEGDAYYCTYKGKIMSETAIKHANHCKEYVTSVLGSIITGKKYSPKPPRKKLKDVPLFEDERR